MRAQFFYPASDFSALPEDQRTFVQLAFRPDYLVTGSTTAHFPSDFELRLSTATRTFGTLSSTFADNIGADETVVFSGDWHMYTDGNGPPEGPCAFDYVIEFQTPFVYDPNQGGLLMEMRFPDGCTGTPAFDADNSAAEHKMLYGMGTSASQAIAEIPGAIVAQFDAVPEPSTAVYVFGLAIGLTSMPWWRKRRA